MLTPPITLAGEVALVRDGLARIREEQHVPTGFPPDVEAEVTAAAAEGARGARDDATDVPFVTIDPLGSRDLDQAFHAERTPGGYRVRYAIADVAAFITTGGALDKESWARGVTLYLPDERAPLYPPALGEGAASLLPDIDRPALLWDIELDVKGQPVGTRVSRALVRSRAQLDYLGVQAQIDAGTAPELLVLLSEIGRLRQAIEVARGGVSLNLPSQRVVADREVFALEIERTVPAMGWNAQISLLTGMEAARMMVDGGVGILRTLPPADAKTLGAIRRSALALHIPWPEGSSYADVVRTLDPSVPAQAALLTQAAHALRGAGYVAFSGGAVPAEATHAAVAATYAHVTAPLRRLADRYANEVVLALCSGTSIPDAVSASLPELPQVMGRARSHESSVNGAVLDLIEACVLLGHVGKVYTAVVTNVDEHGSMVQLRDPPVLTRVAGAQLALGDEVDVRVVSADPVARKVELEVA